MSKKKEEQSHYETVKTWQTEIDGDVLIRNGFKISMNKPDF